MRKEEALFRGVYPGGIVYADTRTEENGDYKTLAFLSYGTLELKVYHRNDLYAQIVDDAQRMRARRGELYPISTCGQTVMLGGRQE